MACGEAGQRVIDALRLLPAFLDVRAHALVHLRVVFQSTDLPLEQFDRLVLHRVLVTQADDEHIACLIPVGVHGLVSRAAGTGMALHIQ